MKCPRCDSDNVDVIESRPYQGTCKRRRECRDCKVRFNTLEVLDTEYKYLKYKESALAMMTEMGV